MKIINIHPIFENRDFLLNILIEDKVNIYSSYNQFIDNYKNNYYLQIFVDDYYEINKFEGLHNYFSNYNIEDRILIKQLIVTLVKTDIKTLENDIFNNWLEYKEVIKYFKEISNKELLNSSVNLVQSLELNKDKIPSFYNKNWIRLFAVKLIHNQIIITGGLIKHSNRIEKTDIGYNQFQILNETIEFSKQKFRII